MADVSAFNGAERPRVNWGKWTLIAIGALFLCCCWWCR